MKGFGFRGRWHADEEGVVREVCRQNIFLNQALCAAIPCERVALAWTLVLAEDRSHAMF